MESKAVRILPVTIIAVTALALACSFTYAYDPSPLQNICVAVSNNSSPVFVNGKVCKNPTQVTVEDFAYSGLHIPGNTNNTLGFAANVVTVNQVPGLNTLGLSIVRSDFAPRGIAVPHMHPRASEISVILEGTIYAGFVDSFPGIQGTKSKLFAKTYNAGDVFVVPIGMIHFAQNVGKTKATVLSAFNSQSFGFVRIPGDIFGTDPAISPDFLAKGFQLDKKEVQFLQTLNW